MRIFQNKKGATAIEYVLVASIFAVICIVAFTNMSDSTTGLFDRISEAVAGANEPAEDGE